MKNLIFINGTMGAGKSAVSRRLRDLLAPCAFLDGDWCWDMAPFTVTDETKEMVQENITAVLQNFLNCSAFQNIVFCWVMQQDSIAEGLLSRLELSDTRVYRFTLEVSEPVLRARLEQDVRDGLRMPDVIERSVARIPLYRDMDTVKIDTDRLTVEQAAGEIAAQVLRSRKT